MRADYETIGSNAAAQFTLKLHRGDGMLLLGMNWREHRPPDDFVGFAIEYREPGESRFWAVHNRFGFEGADTQDPNVTATLRSPIQKFRWVHFPYHADLPGKFTYRVTPVFMNAVGVLSYGEPQTADIELARETYPGELNVAFTRGFVSSQAFVDHFASRGQKVSTLLPTSAKRGLEFTSSRPDAEQAWDWMGFEARSVIVELLDAVINDTTTTVRVIAYDLNEPEIVSRLEKLLSRLWIIIDNSGSHGRSDSAETAAATRLARTAGSDHIKRQHMADLQHNKTIVATGPRLNRAICGSTNLSWRGFLVQNNNAVVLTGQDPVAPFVDAFEQYWASDSAADFGASPSSTWTALGLKGIDARVAFSPHSERNALLSSIGADIGKTKSSLLYSLAFLYQTTGPIRDAVTAATENDHIFVYGVSDRPVDGIDVQRPNSNPQPVSPAALSKHVPALFKPEPTGGAGIRMHHKFVVIDFDKPTARVYLGSYNFSEPADTANGENLLLIRDRRIAVSYAVEAVRIFDHYEFRLKQEDPKTAVTRLSLQKPPTSRGAKPWWDEDYTDATKIRDRLLFA
jgi:hypothetical protein